MNSESMNDILSYEKTYVEKEKDRRDKIESTSINEGQHMEILLNSTGWKILQRDLESLTVGLFNKLRHEKNLNKSQMERIIDQINHIDLFKSTPYKYVERMRTLLKRKIKGG